MTNLTQLEKDKFLDEHLHHRLTLLRTLRDREKSKHNYQGQAGIFCCVKDSSLIAIRLLLDFLGLKGKFAGTSYSLERNPRKAWRMYDDDVKIDQFGLQLLTPADVPQISHEILAGVYIRADKELAHLTLKFNKQFNQESILIEAATIIEDLLQKHFYTPLGKQMPKMIS